MIIASNGRGTSRRSHKRPDHLLAFGDRKRQYNQRIERPIAERQGYVIDPLRATALLTDAPPGSVQGKVEEMAAQVYLMQQLLADRRIRDYNEVASATHKEQLTAAPQLALQLPQNVVYKRQLKKEHQVHQPRRSNSPHSGIHQCWTGMSQTPAIQARQ